MNAMYLARIVQDGPLMMQHNEETWVTSLFRLLMLALVVAGVVWVAKILVQHSTSDNGETTKNTPLDVAKERYAKGDITKAQLDEIRKELNK